MWSVIICAQAVTLEDFQLVTDPPRPNSPWAVRVALKHSGGTVETGVVGFRVLDLSNRAQLDYRTEALTVGSDALRRLLWLPPWQRHEEFGVDLKLQISWHPETGDKRLLATQALKPTSTYATKHHTFTIIGSMLESAGTLLENVTLSRALDLRGYETKSETKNHLSKLVASEFPVSPLRYCAFDLVIVPKEDFQRLRASQLNALRRWVTAGGKFIVVPFGVPLEQRHVDFLNQLGRDDSDQWTFRLEPQTKLLQDYDRSYSRHAPGLGRALIIAKFPNWNLRKEMESWMRSLSFLWQVPLTTREEIDARKKAIDGFRRSPGSGRFQEVAALNDQKLRDWVDRQSPSSQARPVPLLWLGLSSVVFLFVVGPFDRRLFTRLKRRKLTWVWFPLVTILFTQFLIQMANWHRKGQEKRKIVHVIDIDRRGEVLRKSTFIMDLIGQERNSSLSHRQAIATELVSNETNQLNTTIPGRIKGSYPVNFSQEYHLRRWTSHQTRAFHIPSSDTLAPHKTLATIDWSAAPLSHQLNTLVGPCHLIENDHPLAQLGTRYRYHYDVFQPPSISPRGGDSLEDLQLDPTPSARFTSHAVEITEGNEVFLYRVILPKTTP